MSTITRRALAGGGVLGGAIGLASALAAPAIALQGEADGVQPPEASAKHGAHFTGPFMRRVLPGVGHNPPQEAPQAFADAVLELIQRTET